MQTTIEQYLHEHIPLSRAMGVKVASADVDAVVLTAPLKPNINHHETVFGGSASAVAILAAWSLLHTRLQAAGIVCGLVIHRNTMEYERPIRGDFSARATVEEGADWRQFTRILARKGKARITVRSILEQGGEIVGRLSGEFVAMTDRLR